MTICDIVIPVYNQPDLTCACIESIYKTTRIPINLIIVDNGSDPQTKEVLNNFKPNDFIKIEIITNSANHGFSKAVNQGLKLENSPFKLILNNDTVFTDNCLELMIGIAKAHHDIGLVNPESNTFGSRPARGESAEDAGKRIAPLKDQFIEFSNCIGFAMLVKKEVIEKIGYLDEAFGTGYFEDSDFSMRAKNAGYRCVKACGAYIFHHEHKSLEKLAHKEQLFQKNKALYEKRWGRPLRIFCTVSGSFAKDKSNLKHLLHDAVMLARKECYLYLVIGSGKKGDKRQFFREAHLVEMTNIDLKPVRPALFLIYSIYRIIKRRKKRYHLILTYEPHVAKLLEKISFLFKLPVYCRTGCDLSKILELKKSKICI